MIAFRVSLIVFAAYFVAGCTTSLKVEPYSAPADGDVESRGYGVVYFLPKAQYDVALTRRLTQCDANGVTVKFDVVVKTNYVPDTASTYQIRYEDLSSPTKKTDIKVDLYENGTLKSVNAEAVDETRQVIANVISGVGSLGLTLAGGVFKPTFIEGIDKPSLPCHENISGSIASLRKTVQRSGKLEVEIADKKVAIVDNAGDPKALKKLRAELKALEEQLEELQKQSKGLATLLTDDQSYSVSPEKSGVEKSLLSNEVLLNKWFTEEAIKNGLLLGEKDQKQRKMVTDLTKATLVVNLSGSITSVAPKDALIACKKSSEDEQCKPLFYRQPVVGTLMVCKETCFNGSTTNPKAVISSAQTLIPQLGPLSSLSFRNGPFEDNSLKVTFNSAGGIETFGSASKASAVEASAAFKDSVDAIAKYRDQKRTLDIQKLNEDADRLKAAKARIDAELELEKSRKALDAFKTQ